MLDVNTKMFSEPNFSKKMREYGQILFIQFSQFECSQDVLLIAFKERVVLSYLNLDDNIIDLEILSEFTHPFRCTSLSISPQTMLNIKPSVLVFCSAATDYNLRVFCSNLNDDNLCKVLTGHKSYINDVGYDPENIFLASTSDDHTVKVWMATSLSLKSTFTLSSPGISLCWHKGDPGKLLVAEKMGIISFYNVENETCIFSSDYGKSLSSCHWSPSDCDLMTSIHQGELLVWQLSNKCLPLYKCMIFPENGGNVKFSTREELIAAVNHLDNSLKVLHLKSQTIKLSANVSLPTNVSWHYRYPLVCVGDDCNLNFWKVSSN